eukprot:3113504-Alexandrium_andersonii.AAC.1
MQSLHSHKSRRARDLQPRVFSAKPPAPPPRTSACAYACAWSSGLSFVCCLLSLNGYYTGIDLVTGYQP